MKKEKTDMHPIPSIAVEYADAGQEKRARLLAEKLDLPPAVRGKQYDLILRCTGMGLELFRPGDPQLTGSVRAEFVAGPSGYRRSRGGAEMLIRAIGHKKKERTRVLDATGGLGRDAFIMASHGCLVLVMEKNPVAAALLADGLQRAAGRPQTEEISRRITLIAGDSSELLQEETRKERFDVIYLDPMFPKRSKAARVKKELQILQQLVGCDENSERLFTLALQAAGKRVVVKRPKGAHPLPGPKPSYSLTGKTTRFDVYLAGGQAGRPQAESFTL